MRHPEIALLAMLFITTTFAQQCPSINDIKAHHLNGWHAYDSEDKRALSTPRFNHFKTNVKEFALAEWENKQKGTIHCYYRDQYGSSLEAYLSKNNFLPDNTKNYWYDVSGFRECAASPNNCQFKINNNKKLAIR